MQRGEYCTLWRRGDTPARWCPTLYRAEGPLDRGLRPDEGAGERGLRDVWARTIARLGREGRELVAVGGTGLHFKRPVPARAAANPQAAVPGDTAGLPVAAKEAREGGTAGPGRGQGAARGAATCAGREVHPLSGLGAGPRRGGRA